MDELSRILALPRRPPVNCEREPGTRRWAPEAQALIELVTAEHTRGRRLSCACRDRHVKMTASGLVIFHVGRPDRPPPAPVETTVDAFAIDNYHDPDTVKTVANLRVGQSVDLPGLGYPVCIEEFNPMQAWALWEAPQAGGLFCMSSVGSGKTWIGIMLPMAMKHIRTWAILIKSSQRRHYQKHYLRLREHFNVPTIVFDNLQGYRVAGAPALHVMPYSVLSSTESSQVLETLKPGGLLADEVHLLANPDSSRAIRWDRFMCKNNGTFFGGWSGSVIKRKLRDRTKVTKHALGLGSPDPIKEKDVEAISAVIDPVHSPDRESDLAQRLRYSFGTRSDVQRAFFVSSYIDDGGVRDGYREWVLNTPGVISTKSSSVNCSIVMKERRPEMPQVVKEALDGVRGAWVRPDGEELVEAVEQVKCAREVIAGYYNYWAFPKMEPVELIEEWYAARKPFNKELRVKIRNGEPNLDSRALCERAAARAWMSPPYVGTLPVWPAESWPAWAKIKDKVQPDPRTKWLDEYLARDAAEWAKQHRGVVWVQSPEFGQRVAKLAGIPYHGGGPNAEANIMAEKGDRSIVASLKAHGESRDGLQLLFYKQYVVEMPASGDAWEQLLGRLAREGQPEDTVETWVPVHAFEFREALRKALSLAEFIESMTGNRQLILAADWEFDL